MFYLTISRKQHFIIRNTYNEDVPGKTGNTNALKHGLYAKQFTDAERKLLKQMPESDLRQEIALLRVVVDRVLTAFAAIEDDADALAKTATALTAAVLALNTTMRTHALLSGDYSPLADADDEAILAFDPYKE